MVNHNGLYIYRDSDPQGERVIIVLKFFSNGKVSKIEENDSTEITDQVLEDTFLSLKLEELENEGFNSQFAPFEISDNELLIRFPLELKIDNRNPNDFIEFKGQINELELNLIMRGHWFIQQKGEYDYAFSHSMSFKFLECNNSFH